MLSVSDEGTFFEPALRFCRSCSKQICTKGTFYCIKPAYCREYGDDLHNSLCSKCFNISGDSVKAGKVCIPKDRLEMKRDYGVIDAKSELWVQCHKCKARQHQICALFNDKINLDVQVPYTCPNCFLQDIETGVCKPLPQSMVLVAENLPTTMLSDHIEEWLSRSLEKERRKRASALGKSTDEVPGAEALVVRVVSSVDKKLEVKEHFRKIFEKYPPEFPYKSKVILLFQKIEGADVCLFSMYVQEFGSECPFPNQRRFYISYIDSVKYFRPEIKTVDGEALRTFVYHEILIGYLDYCKRRGFTSGYIWSCPSVKRDDYILYCHPKEQKMPKAEKLREWYQSMIRKAVKQKIVVEHTNLYDHFFKPPSDCKVKITASRLPYFDGDYWPGEAECLLEKGDGSMPQKKASKAVIDRVLRAAKRDSLTGNPKDILLMHQLGENIRPIKEDFIMIHLQYTCKHCCQPIVSGNLWICNERKNFHLCHKCYYLRQNEDRCSMKAKKNYSYSKVEASSIPTDTCDKDQPLESECFDTRMMFLTLCQGNHYQFDTLRRAKHSTMMILYHLHNPFYDLCGTRYEAGGAKHQHLVSHATIYCCNTKPQKQSRWQQVPWQLRVIKHASTCTASCTSSYCRKLKVLFHHSAKCLTRHTGGCNICKEIWLILKQHALSCKDSECPVPRCKDLKEHRRKMAHLDPCQITGVKERLRQERERLPDAVATDLVQPKLNSGLS